ncbi:PREDICTED: uncharacterized protein LOC109213045 [Nicotiana attenuata]|uniref:uncharacterized protein LOC109213045 n=1 Tax=Nicotiana attenuata TaxID=49451 RepID=UPI000904BA78|nr:PREDICTED: uncharacterized protein LOC109213045 [Nicotiana attenuata]
MTADTITPSYWLNWRFLICGIWILAAMLVSAVIIWKYEGFSKSRSQQIENHELINKAGFLYKDEVWKACYKGIHPVWLLVYRLIAFALLLSLLIADVVTHRLRILNFYTQWTFTLVTIYFGLGSSLSIHGCLESRKGGNSENSDVVDAERGSYSSDSTPENASVLIVYNGLNSHVREAAGLWGYVFQIIFQACICAGGVVITDCFFWLLIYPSHIYESNWVHFLAVCMHSFNTICLLGDTFLNCLRFPFFRIAYFVLWTCIFVSFQWIIHIYVSTRWPYPFLDFSSQYGPFGYFAVGILHLPCYGIFAVLIRIKKYWLS